MDLHWLKLQDGALRPLHPRTNYSSLHETSHHVTTQRTKPRITILYLFQLLNKICLYKKKKKISIIKNRLLNNKPTFTCFIDMSKAFDWVNRDLLFLRLLQYGVDGKFYRTIKTL